MVKNPPCKERDTGMVPGWGRSHLTLGNWAHGPQLQSPSFRTCEWHVALYWQKGKEITAWGIISDSFAGGI